jgi:ABC-type sulfate/molybdate transport systems ATPase subunit
LSLAVDYRLSAPVVLHAAFEIRGFTALLGRSGAGKTTLLKALAGLLPAAGTPWFGLGPAVRPVGYLPQGAALFPHLTARGNAAYALRGPDRMGRAQRLLESLGIGALGDRPAGLLSGGEAQRVALARALARQPELLLLDEPSAALDAATRDDMLSWLAGAVAARAIPALVATHDPLVAGRADWLVLLAEGRVIQQGRPRAVFEAPVSAAAALLLGYQNIWEEAGVRYAIRAEDIEVVAEGRPARVLAIREQGPDLRLDCALPSPVSLLLRGGNAADFTIGQTIHLRLPAARLRRLE